MTEIVTKRTIINAGQAKAEESQTAQYVVYFIFGAIETLLAFRLILKITGANPISGFVNFIYSLTQLLILPFVGIFRQATTTGIETTAILEPAVIVAVIVYAVIAWGIVQLIEIMSGRLQ